MTSKILTLDRLLELYPWADEHLGGQAPLEWLWRFPMRCSPAQLWPRIVDTSRFNRALGLGEMTFEERDGVLHGSSRNGGVRHEWIEVPWDWVAEHHLVAVRVYSRGFARIVRAVYHLVPTPEGCEFYVYFGWVPRGTLGRLALKVGVPSLEKQYQRVLSAIEADLAEPVPEVYRAPGPALDPTQMERLASLQRTLAGRGLPREILDRVSAFVREADDMDAYRIQVRQLAARWGIDWRQLLSVCLHATRDGLLNLSWDVICPHCRGVRAETTTLGDVAATGNCDVCEIDFSTDTENSVEITFHVHPSIRDVPKVYYCSAEPSTKQHIRVQYTLAPRQKLELSTRLGVGRYRMRARGEKRADFIDVLADADATVGEWSAGRRRPDQSVGENPTLVVENDTDEVQQLTVEEARWTDVALRPMELFNVQEFRDLFTEEYVGTDVRLNIGEQTILFTDMVGSTRFYIDRGDPAAFVAVREHFRELFAVVADNRGAVVKTIGDATMASFSDPVDALRASKQMFDRFPPPGNGRDARDIQIRISLNTGPCIAVNLNSAIDYFGGTVNIAAKLQACAESGQVAMSQSVRQAPGVDEFLTEQRATLVEGIYDNPPLEPVPYTRWDWGQAPGS